MDSLEFLDDLTVAWLLLTHSSNSDIRVGDGPRSPGTHRLGAPGEREDAIQTGTAWLDSDGRAAGALARLAVARL